MLHQFFPQIQIYFNTYCLLSRPPTAPTAAAEMASLLSSLLYLLITAVCSSSLRATSISSFHKLLSLDLSGNPALLGPIPEQPPAVDSNPLAIPKRYVLTETTNSTSNSTSKGLYHRRGNNSSTTSVVAPAPSPAASPAKHHRWGKKKKRGLILGFVVGALMGVISGVLLTFLFRLLVNFARGMYSKFGSPAIYSPIIKRAEDLAFLEKEDGLASLELIGRGGCGEVYRKELDGGKMIAIKKIVKFRVSDPTTELGEEESKLLDKRMRQLRSEIKTVGYIRHRNILPLLAHVPRPDCNYLVYEFMKNGSLQDMLKAAANGTQELPWPTRTQELPWPTRLRIAQGVAAGLEYLHTQHSPRIIHRDLKPGNILLDDNLEARIADFGLAKAIPDAHTHVTTMNVAGTVGYIAPEYHQILKFTDKCDIYSFGVILAVLVVGRMPSDDYFVTTAEMSMVKWLRRVMSSGDEEVVQAIDPEIRGKGFDDQIRLVMRIACFCTADDPKKRPNSKDVRCMLSQIQAISAVVYLT